MLMFPNKIVNNMSGKVAAPKPALTFVDAVAITALSCRHFETPSLVAVNVGSGGVALLAWLLGAGCH